jgi:hypothetical protein
MATRSGARFKPEEPVQTSVWFHCILDVAEVLLAVLNSKLTTAELMLSSGSSSKRDSVQTLFFSCR